MAAQPIHALNAGDGLLALSGLPGARGDYRADLDHIHDWQPGLVISLTTEAEMAVAGATHLGADLGAMGCRWVHLPIEDFGTPQRDVQVLWPEVSASARHALLGGGRVLVHCRGGCGRSGMIALRLLVELGEDADVALRRLRAVRPCAVETGDQRRWAGQARRF